MKKLKQLLKNVFTGKSKTVDFNALIGALIALGVTVHPVVFLGGNILLRLITKKPLIEEKKIGE